MGQKKKQAAFALHCAESPTAGSHGKLEGQAAKARASLPSGAANLHQGGFQQIMKLSLTAFIGNICI